MENLTTLVKLFPPERVMAERATRRTWSRRNVTDGYFHLLADHLEVDIIPMMSSNHQSNLDTTRNDFWFVLENRSLLMRNTEDGRSVALRYVRH